MLKYFENKDFNSYTHGLMVCATAMAYNIVYEYSRSLGITWIDVPFGDMLKHRSPPLTPGTSSIYFTLLFLMPALFFSLRMCFKRITAGEIHWQDGIKNWFKTIFAYFITFLASLVFWPLIVHTLRGW